MSSRVRYGNILSFDFINANFSSIPLTFRSNLQYRVTKRWEWIWDSESGFSIFYFRNKHIESAFRPLRSNTNFFIRKNISTSTRIQGFKRDSLRYTWEYLTQTQHLCFSSITVQFIRWEFYLSFFSFFHSNEWFMKPNKWKWSTSNYNSFCKKLSCFSLFK